VRLPRAGLTLGIVLVASMTGAMASASGLLEGKGEFVKPGTLPGIVVPKGVTATLPDKLKAPQIDPDKISPVQLKLPDKGDSTAGTATPAPPVTRTPVKSPSRPPLPDDETSPVSATDLVTPPGPGDGDKEPRPRPSRGADVSGGHRSTESSSRAPAMSMDADVDAPEAPSAEIPRRPMSTGSLLGASMPDFDGDGSTAPSQQPVDFEPGQLVFLAPDLEVARHIAGLVATHGYRLRSRTRLNGLGMVLNVVALPPDVEAAQAVNLFADSFPEIVVDLNHRYRLHGSPRTYAKGLIGWDDSRDCRAGARIGMIDTDVDIDDPLLRGVRVTRLEVMPAGLPRADPSHGIAVAALLSGAEQEGFSGLVRSGALFAVDVFRAADGGGAESLVEWIVRAMDVLADHRVDVVNMSLGGAHNRVLEAAVAALLDRNIPIVAAAGNGGAKAAPAFPAAYPGVIAVTAVDAAKRAYRQANTGAYIDFAAPGVDIFVPSDAGGSYRTGTSYAAPFVSAAVAEIRSLHPALPIEQIREYLVQLSQDLGPTGRDDVYGWGLPDFTAHCSRIAQWAP
jgi:hypothetical protein